METNANIYKNKQDKGLVWQVPFPRRLYQHQS
jgi:hypothetical protein